MKNDASRFEPRFCGSQMRSIRAPTDSVMLSVIVYLLIKKT